jgi:hypothetical protein
MEERAGFLIDYTLQRINSPLRWRAAPVRGVVSDFD